MTTMPYESPNSVHSSPQSYPQEVDSLPDFYIHRPRHQPPKSTSLSALQTTTTPHEHDPSEYTARPGNAHHHAQFHSQSLPLPEKPPEPESSKECSVTTPGLENGLSRPLLAQEQERLEQLDRLKFFLATAPSHWDAAGVPVNSSQDQLVSHSHLPPHHPSLPPTHPSLNRFLLSNQEYVSCVLWNGLYHITGTDIVRALVYRFEAFGRPVRNMKKFEEGVFSDLRNLKPGVDACLEEPKSPFLDLLFKYQCIRTQKKQKVFFWFSVPHDRLFLDALERDLKREKMGLEPTTQIVGEPALSFTYDPKRSLYEQFVAKVQGDEDEAGDGEDEAESDTGDREEGDGGEGDDEADHASTGHKSKSRRRQSSADDDPGSTSDASSLHSSTSDTKDRPAGKKRKRRQLPATLTHQTPFFSMFSLFEGSPTYKQRRKKTNTANNNNSNAGKASSGLASGVVLQGPGSGSAGYGYSNGNNVYGGPGVYGESGDEGGVPGMSAAEMFMRQARGELGGAGPGAGAGGVRKRRDTQTQWRHSFHYAPSHAQGQEGMYFGGGGPGQFGEMEMGAGMDFSSGFGGMDNAGSSAGNLDLGLQRTRSVDDDIHIGMSRGGFAAPHSAGYVNTGFDVPSHGEMDMGFQQTDDLGLPSSLPNPSAFTSFGNPNPYGSPVFGSNQPLPGNNQFQSQVPQHAHTLPQSGPGQQKSFTCPLYSCGRLFKRMEHLKRHLRTHTLERPYMCPKCKKRFSRSDNLNQHVRTHMRGEQNSGGNANTGNAGAVGGTLMGSMSAGGMEWYASGEDDNDIDGSDTGGLESESMDELDGAESDYSSSGLFMSSSLPSSDLNLNQMSLNNPAQPQSHSPLSMNMGLDVGMSMSSVAAGGIEMNLGMFGGASGLGMGMGMVGGIGGVSGMSSAAAAANVAERRASGSPAAAAGTSDVQMLENSEGIPQQRQQQWAMRDSRGSPAFSESSPPPQSNPSAAAPSNASTSSSRSSPGYQYGSTGAGAGVVAEEGSYILSLGPGAGAGGIPMSAPPHKQGFDHGPLYPPSVLLDHGGGSGGPVRRHRSMTPGMARSGEPARRPMTSSGELPGGPANGVGVGVGPAGSGAGSVPAGHRAYHPYAYATSSSNTVSRTGSAQSSPAGFSIALPLAADFSGMQHQYGMGMGMRRSDSRASNASVNSAASVEGQMRTVMSMEDHHMQRRSGSGGSVAGHAGVSGGPGTYGEIFRTDSPASFGVTDSPAPFVSELPGQVMYGQEAGYFGHAHGPM